MKLYDTSWIQIPPVPIPLDNLKAIKYNKQINIICNFNTSLLRVYNYNRSEITKTTLDIL